MPDSVHEKFHKTVDRKPLTVNKRRSRFGFTLLELLLAIAIAGTLASIITVTFVGEQKKARDTQRKRDLNTAKSTLEIVKRDCSNLYYPYFVGSGTGAYGNLGNYLTNANLKYIGNWPKDPKTKNNYQYFAGSEINSVCPDTSGTRTASGNLNYSLRATLEITNDSDIQKSFDRCLGKPGMPGTPSGFYYICND